MKKYWKLSAFTLAAAVLTACGADDEAANNNDANENEGNAEMEGEENAEIDFIGDDDAEVELDFWLFGANYDLLIEEYIEENPDISINVQQIDMEDHHNNLFTSLSAGSGAPDIAAIEVSEIERYKNAEEQFYNLYDLGAEEIEEDYLDWVWDLGSSQDGDFAFGVPTDIGPTVMYYRTDVFEDAGLPSDPDDVDEMIETWDDYEEAAATILEETGKPMADNPETVFNAKRDQAPEQYFNEEDELIIDSSPYVREAYDDTSEWIKADYVDNFGLWSPEWSNGMAEGEYATLLGPAWMRDTIKENAPDATEWRIASMPEGAGNWGGSWMTIPKETDHAEEAYDFLTWLLAPEQQQKSFEERGMFPSTPEVYEEPDFQEITDEYYGDQNVAEIFAEAALEVEYVYKGEDYPNVNEEILDGLDNVYDGNDPDEEWEEILERIEQHLRR